MSTEAVNALLYGTSGEKIEMHRTNEFGSGVYYNTFEGIVENLERRFRETNSEWMKEEIGSFMSVSYTHLPAAPRAPPWPSGAGGLSRR